MPTSPSASTISFEDDAVQKVLRTWWEGLAENRGDRAELRRCTTIDRVLLSEAYHRLRQRITSAGLSFAEEQLAAATGLLAHVGEHADDQPHLAVQMAGGDDEAPVSGRRFRRLLSREDREDLYRPMIRIVRLLKRRVNVYALAGDVYYWGPPVRKRWAQRYYQHALEEV